MVQENEVTRFIPISFSEISKTINAYTEVLLELYDLTEDVDGAVRYKSRDEKYRNACIVSIARLMLAEIDNIAMIDNYYSLEMDKSFFLVKKGTNGNKIKIEFHGCKASPDELREEIKSKLLEPPKE